MNKKTNLLAMMMILLSFGTSFSQTDQKAFGQEQSKEKKAVTLALDLKNYGLENNDPIFLISSAQILIDYSVSKKNVVGKASDIGGTTTENSKTEKNDIDLDATALLNKARSLAGKNKEILAMVSRVETNLQNKNLAPTTSKGATYYNGGFYDSFNVYSSKIIYITFSGGEFAEIRFIGDGDTDLDFYIYNEDGDLLDKDIDYTDEAGWSWRPRYTQQYKFKIVNRGDVYNKVTVLTN